MKLESLFLALVAMLGAGSITRAAIFSDLFDSSASAGNYTVSTSSADTDVVFGFDYSTLGIEAAPNTTDGSTLGLRMAANLVSPGAAEGITLHTNQTFSGRYLLSFDAWINANGPLPGGGGGSTEFLTAGVGGNGSAVNLAGTSGSGGWTAVTGEGGSSRDYRMYKASDEQFAESGQFAAGTSSAGGGAHNSSNAYYSQFGNVDVTALGQGGSQTGTTGPGTFGFAWREVSLLVGDGTAEWSIDGLRIGTLDAGIGTTFETDGSVTIGYMDIFSSVSDAPQYSFGLVDNLTVTAIPEPASCHFILGLSAVVALRRRRRRRC